ncbi:MAG TPA: hypothetical protein VGM32_07405, partial [Rhodopila sp.]
NGKSWTVLERRAGRYHPFGNCKSPGVTLDDPAASALFRPGQCLQERNARRLLADIADEWRSLLEHVR